MNKMAVLSAVYNRKGVNNLVIMCTYACQFACTYCEVKQSNLSMPDKILYKAIDLLLTASDRQCRIKFWGGEPLLRWDFIKEGILYAEKKAREKGKQIKFMITTNGLLLEDEKLNFLKRHAVEIMFSIDGDRDTCGTHRLLKNKKHYYEGLFANLERLINSGLSYFVNLVVTPATVNKLYENFEFLRNLNVKKVQVCYRNGILWSEKNIETLVNEFRKFILNYKDRGFLMNFVNNCEPTMLSQEIVVDIDGKLYFDAAIFMERKFPRLRNSYFLGNVDKISDIDSLFKSRSELYRIFRDSCPKKQREVFLNNVNLGLKLDSLFKSYADHALDSSEHPVITHVVKGDFSCQREILKKLKMNCLFLYLDGPCLNNCLFCKHKEEEFSDFFRVEMKLSDNLRIKSRKLCIIGNEPLLHPEIEKILGLTKKYGFSAIEIMTSGERLSDESFCRRIIDKGVTSFSLPIFAREKKVHDFVVGREGSFCQVIKGIKNALAAKADIFVHTNLIKQNIDQIKDLEAFVKEELRLPFVILPIRPKTSNLSFQELIPSYGQVIQKLKGINSLLGFPLCVIKRAQSVLFKTEAEISDSMKLYLLDQKFTKVKACKSCIHFNRCLGLFKEYGYFYPLDTIRPISRPE